jgi:hypothetical protein
VLAGHFDNLIRAAIMQPPEVIEYLKKLLRETAGGGTSAVPVSA